MEVLHLVWVWIRISKPTFVCFDHLFPLPSAWTVRSHEFIVQRTKTLFTYCSCTVHGSHDTIHTFKNYFAIVFSVFSFSKNKLYPNRPLVWVWIRISKPTFAFLDFFFSSAWTVTSHEFTRQKTLFMHYSQVPRHYSHI